MRSMQPGPTTSGNAIVYGQRELAQNSVEMAMQRDDLGDSSVGRFGTMPGAWQDLQIHLRSSASGRSAQAYHDIVDFVGRDTVEEMVVAGAQIILLKSGVKPKLESLTLSQWSIASLALHSGWRGEDRWKQHVRLSIIYHKDISA